MRRLVRRPLIVVVAILGVLFGSAPAAAQGQPVAPGWKIYPYAPSGMALSSRTASASADAIAQFTFLATPGDALFATQRPLGPHGSILGKTISATFRIDAAAGTTFAYWGEGTPANPCGTPATARFYFNTNGKFGFGTDNDWYSKYWWSNPASVILAPGEFTLSAPVAVGPWSNWDGKMSADRVAGFTAAASDPDFVGLSFGGGCFFENGVGTPTGSATFVLESWTIE
ncbi:MAG: hypothetical protein KGJ98_12780 [Chloroflexota bacterium]|nr:hypothetical protein [Chloroflexota bacterium]MDE3103097.1 hypothetical protein [Chloroflexota bacterium]